MLKKQTALKYVLAAMLLTGLMFGALPVFAQTAETMVDKIVVVVNEDIITAHELNKRLKQAYFSIENAPISDAEKALAREQVQQEIINEMVEEKLMAQEIKRYNISVSDAEVNDAINTIKANNNFTDEALREALALQGFDYESYREEIQRQILNSKLMNRQIRSRVVVTDADIERYFNEHADDLLSTRQYNIWNLFVRWPENGGAQARNQALATIENLYIRLEGGESFKALAQASGQTYGGGELGVYRLNEIAPDFRPVIAELDAGSYSKIMMGNGAAQIFYVDEVILAENQTLEDVRPEIEETLQREALEKRFTAWMEELKEQAHIEILKD